MFLNNGHVRLKQLVSFGLIDEVGLLWGKLQQSALTVNLVRRDQYEALADITGKSQAERFVEAVLRSHERAAYYTQKLSPNAFGSQDFQSPVKAGNGEYLMTLTLGSPPQTFDVIVDTGSDLNWVQCLPCKVCYQQPGPKFDPSKSSSFRKTSCADNLCNVSSVFFTLISVLIS